MTAEGEAKNSTSVPPAANTVEGEESAQPMKQTKVVLLTGFGGPKYLKVQSKDQRSVCKGEIAIDVEAW